MSFWKTCLNMLIVIAPENFWQFWDLNFVKFAADRHLSLHHFNTFIFVHISDARLSDELVILQTDKVVVNEGKNTKNSKKRHSAIHFGRLSSSRRKVKYSKIEDFHKATNISRSWHSLNKEAGSIIIDRNRWKPNILRGRNLQCGRWNRLWVNLHPPRKLKRIIKRNEEGVSF